jgi:hypothetical protein
MVDNGSGVPEQLYANSHAYTEDTQTNWNGIIGEIFLSIMDNDKLSIANSQLSMRRSWSGSWVRKDSSIMEKETTLIAPP